MGHFGATAEAVRPYIDQGFTLIIAGMDSLLMAGGAQEVVKALTERARELRRKQTPAEAILWQALRGRKLAGVNYRRQNPFTLFVLDCYCAEHKLVVEVDGKVHRKPDQLAHGAARTFYLDEHDVCVIRFPNEQVKAKL